ncbi:MAG: hormogonium polysaccharide biosynthesis protein HpsA [Limnoraphis sp.]
MSKHKKSNLSILSRLQNVYRPIERIIQRLMRSLLRTWMRVNRRDRYGRAGFVLPTVVMVLLVVVLLTIAITLRSFDRAKIAQYRRVDEAVLQAATPALDRARSKIDYLLQEDKTLPRATPSDRELYRALSDQTLYQLADEEVLQVQLDNTGVEPDSQITTAWRFPVDTNNNGKLDSYTLYGIYFLLPTTNNRARTTLEARTPPMQSVQTLSQQCAIAGTSADLIDGSGWVRQDGDLKKSFFVYTATIPITDLTGLDPNQYEKQATKGFSALEYQQDRTRKPLTNNAVLYEDDLEITPGDTMRLNGRIITNSNLITSRFSTGNLRYYLVSSKNSCFYDPENSKILVGGNVINGMSGNNSSNNRINIPVDLFLATDDWTAGQTNPPQENISTTNQSISEGAYDGLYDSERYEDIIGSLVDAQMGNAATSDPQVVQDTVTRRTTDDPTLVPAEVRREELEAYFRERTRKVPFADSANALNYANSVAFGGTGDALRPTNDWTDPTNSDLSLNADQLIADNPENLEENEAHLGNRVLVGNNQPRVEYTVSEFEDAEFDLGNWADDNTARTRPTQIQELPDVGATERHGFWEIAATQEPDPVLAGTGGLRVITGAGVYERESSFLPPPPPAPPLTAGTLNPFPVVWPDTMPMSPSKGSKVYDNASNPYSYDPSEWNTFDTLASSNWPLTTTNSSAPSGSIDPSTPKFAKGDLKMRATAVYHYAKDSFDGTTDDTEQQPIACVSSYYDPSTSITAKNPSGGWEEDPNGRSNNGIVYGPPTANRPGQSNLGSGGLLTGGNATLDQQANFVFPDGRFVNEPLRKALLKAESDRNLADQAAIDSTLCALGILDAPGFGVGAAPSDPTIPNGAIHEVAFLNAREAKAIETDNRATEADERFTLFPDGDLTSTYQLPLEDRYPLEVRATAIDLNELRNQSINFASGIQGPSPEYLLPNSGIIYASRDDALPDRSESDINKTELLSPTDYKLDPSRRPNGILLINGQYLARNSTPTTVQEIVQEKGLTLVSNLPVYIKGRFNIHSDGNGNTQEEFRGGGLLDANWNNFYTRGNNVNEFNPNFACRPNDQRLTTCTDGDTWRPATVLADSVTVLSDNFRFGFRNEGDFDLRNNAGVIRVDGYDLNGNGATDTGIDEGNFRFDSLSGLTFDLNGNGTIDSSLISEVNIVAIPAWLARYRNGFHGYNDFVVNGLSSGAFDSSGAFYASGTRLVDNLYRTDDNNALDSSYFNNFITPIQRRGNNPDQFPEYVMEICRKLPVSACEPNDWEVILDDGSTTNEFDSGNTRDKASNVLTQSVGSLLSGTTATPPSSDLQRFPRRVAFLRNVSGSPPNEIKKDASNLPIPIGVSSASGNPITGFYTGTTRPSGCPAPPSSCQTFAPANLRRSTNALWFQTQNSGNKDWGFNHPLWYFDPNNTNAQASFGSPTVKQPILVPVLQTHAPNNAPTASANRLPVHTNRMANENTKWLFRAANGTTEYNLIVGAGDVPARPGEFNGGLQNLPRALENWEGRTVKIRGSFIQLQRSRYTTAPYISIQNGSRPDNMFGNNAPDNKSSKYGIDNAQGRTGYFMPPVRDWGYDVGLLSQPPDLFAQKFSSPPSAPEADEYFREVSRDDEWITTLLCSKVEGTTNNAVPNEIRPQNCPN